MPSCNFTVPGQPVGKARARVCLRQGQVRAYTPKKTADYEGLVRLMAIEAMRGRRPTNAACTVSVDAYGAFPASWSKKKRFAVPRWITKPDADNIAKCCLDSCNGVAFKDDSQVILLTVRKFYSDTPRVEVKIQWED